ncbi:hypothetical protein Q5P01_018156 [Channa striata]|uniref:Uncharacterized protein n=1 Tax=Channa striata TaxID=64152 RepID=A0AA88S7U1_CHASR|nr:hypothetical protein Q5P01_018156 [Channa striata]
MRVLVMPSHLQLWLRVTWWNAVENSSTGCQENRGDRSCDRPLSGTDRRSWDREARSQLARDSIFEV